MKFQMLFLLTLFLNQFAMSQSADTSAVNDDILFYLNQRWAYARKWDSLQTLRPVMDSCWRYLHEHPRSWVRPSLFAMMWQAETDISRDRTRLNSLIDSMFTYDSLPVTRLDVGEALINRNVDVRKGRILVESAFPKLSNPHHLHRAHLLLAYLDIQDGHRASAEAHYREALSLEPQRDEAWYDYLAFLKASEDTKFGEVMNKFRALEKAKEIRYEKRGESTVNVGENVSGLFAFGFNHESVPIYSPNAEPTVIVIFNFSCTFCLRELVALKPLVAGFPRVRFIYVNIGETRDEMKDIFLKRNEYRYLKDQIVSFDDSVTIYRRFQKAGVGAPRTIVVDRNGVVRYDYLGYGENSISLLREKLRILEH